MERLDPDHLHDYEVRRGVIVASVWSAVAFVLVISSITHIARFGNFRNSVQDHGLLPSSSALLWLVIAAHVTVGTAVLSVPLGNPAGLSLEGRRLLLSLAAALLGALTWYAWRLQRDDTATDCGCGPIATHPSAALVGRNALLLAAAVLLSAGSADPGALPPDQAAAAAATGLVLAVLSHVVATGWGVVKAEQLRLAADHTSRSLRLP